MKMERKTRNCIWRVALSFFVALVLFVHAPLEAHAAAVNGDITIQAFNQSPYIPLSFFGNYTSSGTDRDALIPYVFRGDYNMRFMVAKAGNVDYSYVDGYAVVRVVFSAAHQFAGGTRKNMILSLSNVSAPDGVSASLTIYSVGPASVTVDIAFSFENYFISTNRLVDLTFSLSSVVVAKASNFGESYNYDSWTASVANDYADGHMRFYTDLNGHVPEYTFVRQKLENLELYFSNTYGRLADINNNITSQASNIVNKIQAQINNDNANTTKITNKIQSQINNDNSNTTKTINALNANSQAEIAAANKNSQSEITAANTNSQNEINTANKNADDIMHDYDTSSQDSDNQKFADSQKELQETEDSLFSDALTGFSALDMSNYTIGGFTAVLGAFSFVSNFLQSLYLKMGDFGTIVTIGLVVMIATKVIGSYRFSTGGDSG